MEQNKKIEKTKNFIDLIDACINGEKNLVELLINRPVNINAQDPYGMTLLMYTCKFGHQDLAEFLIANRAYIQTKDLRGVNTLMYAIYSNNTEIIELLLKQGANLNSTDLTGKTILMFAVEKGNKELVKFLISQGLDVNAKDQYGVTAIIIANGCGYKDLVELLLENKAEISNNDFEILSERINKLYINKQSNPKVNPYYVHKFPSYITQTHAWDGWYCNGSTAKFKGNIDSKLLAWLNLIFTNYLLWDGSLVVKWISKINFKGDLLTFVANTGNIPAKIYDYRLFDLKYIKENEMLQRLDPKKFEKKYSTIEEIYYDAKRPIDFLQWFIKSTIGLSRLTRKQDMQAYALAIDLWLEPGFNSTKAIHELYKCNNLMIEYNLVQELNDLGIKSKYIKKLGTILDRIGDLGLALLPGGFEIIRDKLIYDDGGNCASSWIETDHFLYFIQLDWH